jgi:regulator of nucleoside diphosphate kinase
MSDRQIYITDFDYERLMALIKNPGQIEHADAESISSLKNELSRAQLVASRDIPADVATMNSTVRMVDEDTGEEEEYTLVFPSDADILQGKISIMAPIGTAMLGYRVGDIFSWPVPSGERHLRIEQVIYQPEAAGDYEL